MSVESSTSTIQKLLCEMMWSGRDDLVGIATRYELDGPGSNPGGSKNFRSRLDRPWGPPSLLCKGYRVSSPGIKWPGRGVNLRAFIVCCRVNFTFTFTYNAGLEQHWDHSVECEWEQTNAVQHNVTLSYTRPLHPVWVEGSCSAMCDRAIILKVKDNRLHKSRWIPWRVTEPSSS